MNLEEIVFAKKRPDKRKLLDHGFKKQGEKLVRRYDFMGDEFYAIITIDDHAEGHVYDAFSDEEYSLVHLKGKLGAYASKVRDAYRKILEKIADSCFTDVPFDSDQANRLAVYIKQKYGIDPDFIFKDDSNNAVFKNGRKWFALVMYISLEAINGEAKKANIMNLKAAHCVSEKDIFPAYHMNKKNWVTVILDDRLPDSFIEQMIDESYLAVSSPRSRGWIVPANSKWFDVEAYVEENDTFIWHCKNDIHPGDLVFIYLSAPYSCIMYKTQVAEVANGEMILKRLHKYQRGEWSFLILKEYGIKAVRGPRHLPEKLVFKL